MKRHMCADQKIGSLRAVRRASISRLFAISE